MKTTMLIEWKWGLICIVLFQYNRAIANTFDGLDELADMASSLEKLFSGEDCKYTCPNGEKPVADPSHKPSSNGCGAFGIEIKSATLPQMTKCCDAHDFCYDTCGEDKEKCDNNFKKCLTDMCNKLKNTLSAKDYTECEFLDKAFVDTVETAIGCLAFRKAQSNACLKSCNLDSSAATTNKNPSNMLNSLLASPKKKNYYVINYEKQLEEQAKLHKQNSS